MCQFSLKIATGSPRKSTFLTFCMRGTLWWGCPYKKTAFFSEPQCPFWKLTFKLSGNSASFCFAFRSCFVSSGSVIGSFTSSLLSRKEQVSWVTVLLKWLYSLPPVRGAQERVGQVLTRSSSSLPKSQIIVQQRQRPLRSCLSFSFSSPFQAALFIHHTNTSCVSGSYSAVVTLCTWQFSPREMQDFWAICWSVPGWQAWD